MKIGFTGTRGENLPNGGWGGMTVSQKEELKFFLASNREKITEVHHGGCVGSDQQFHDMCLALDLKIIVHPGYSTRDPEDMRYRAKLEGNFTTRNPKPYFSRNRDIVRACSLLIGVPRERVQPEGRSGGTWYTINYARGLNKQVVSILP